MLEYEPHGGLLELREEDLAGVLYQRHGQLQGPRHVGDDLVVTLQYSKPHISPHILKAKFN